MKRILSWAVGIVLISVAAIVISWVIYTPDRALRGVWQTEGYGLIIDVGATTIDVYEHSDVHCTHDQTIPAHTWLINFLEGVQFDRLGDQLALRVAGTLNPIYATSIDAVPALCAEKTPNSPTMVFDVLWEVMNTHYAHFDTHNVDWAARRGLRPQPADTINDPDLFARLQEALTGLDDGHTFLAAGETVWSPSIPPTWHNDRHMMRDTTIAAVPDLSEPSPTGLRVGYAAPRIGYVYMAHMNADPGLGQRADVAASHAFLQIIDYFAGAEAIILDVRYNPGGSDDVSLAYAGFFADETQPVFTKVTRTEEGFTEPFEAILTPQAVHTDVPVVVLTSPYTGSAAEIFTMAMRELPQVTTMGLPTSGGLSDIMSITLPNGWTLGFSHQIYTTVAGEGFERVGVPPDISLALDLGAAQAGRDTMLEAAVAHLRGE